MGLKIIGAIVVAAVIVIGVQAIYTWAREKNRDPLKSHSASGRLYLRLQLGVFLHGGRGRARRRVYNGRVSEVAEPGLHFKIPVVEDTVPISIRQENYRYENVTAYSQDQQIATLVLSCERPAHGQRGGADLYRVRLRRGHGEPGPAPRVNEEVKTIFGGFTAASAIRDRGKLNADIEAAIRANIEGAPLELVSFQLENIDWSDSYEQAVEARATAEAGVATQRQTLEREKVEAEIAVTQAKARADSSVAEAKAPRRGHAPCRRGGSRRDPRAGGGARR